MSALEEGVRLAPRDPAMWSDLATASYARASLPDGAISLARGLEAADKAIELDARDAAAWFNRALLLEELHLRAQAIEAWTKYLALDGSLAWATEAVSALSDSLPGVVANRRFEVTARSAPRRCAGKMGSCRRGRQSRRRAGRPRHCAIASSRRSPVHATIVERHRRAACRSHWRAANAGGQGAPVYAEARARYRRDDVERAARLFDQAIPEFEAVRSPLFLLPGSIGGFCFSARAEMLMLWLMFRTIRSDIGSRPYPSMDGRALWMEGFVLDGIGEARPAVSSFQLALTRFEEASEPSNGAFVQGLLASHFYRIGNDVRAWQAVTAGMSDTQRESMPLLAAVMANSLKFFRASLDFEIEANRIARTANRTATIADTLRLQAIP